MFRLISITLFIFVGCQNHSEAQWSRPELIVRDSLSPELYINASLNSPRIAVTDSALFVAMISVRSNLIRDPLEVLLSTRKNGQWSELFNVSKTTSFSFNPTFAVDNNGAIQMLWQEQLWEIPDTTRPRSPTHLFYVNRKNGVWSQPVSLFSLDCTRAQNSSTSSFETLNDAVMDESGVFHLAIKLSQNNSNPTVNGILYLRCENGQWSAPVHVHDGGGTPQVGAAPDGTIYIAFIEPDFSPGLSPPQFASVFVTKSTDNGKTWSSPSLVHRAGSKPTGRPSVFIDKRGKVHVIFLKSYTDNQVIGNDGVGIWHSISDDGGRTWSAPDTVSRAFQPASVFFNVLRGTIDSSGQLHLLALAQKSIFDPTPITYFTWRNGRWAEPIQLDAVCFGEVRVFDIVADAKGKIHIVWVEKGRTPRGIYYMSSTIATSTVPESAVDKPQSFQLFQNYPNPFNPSTIISYQLPMSSEVRLVIYDALGRELQTLINTRQAAGRYNVQFSINNQLSSGVYFYRLQAGAFIETKKMFLVK